MIPKGFQFAGVRCGLKNKRNDLGIIVSNVPAQCAGVYTQNTVRAACVDFSRAVTDRGIARAFVVNSGNANCCTGEAGAAATARTAELAAEALNLPGDQILVSSTGVIGVPLDMTKVEAGVRAAAGALGRNPQPFMEAILTTDLVEKQAYVEVGPGAIYGVAKGSGMIAPNMATMLAYLVTDLDTSEFDLAACLRTAVDQSFNRMTVDTDSSTNDSLFLMANAASGHRPSLDEFQTALNEVCLSLAKQVARDGEGATKLVEVRVTGSADPLRIARSIADSPLVKTAMFGCDPNWGRVMMAAGKTGVEFDPAKAELRFLASGGEFTLFRHGVRAEFDAKEVSAALKSDYVVVDLNLGDGETAIVYTCDFGYGYVRINAEYTT